MREKSTTEKIWQELMSKKPEPSLPGILYALDRAKFLSGTITYEFEEPWDSPITVKGPGDRAGVLDMPTYLRMASGRMEYPILYAENGAPAYGEEITLSTTPFWRSTP